MENTLSEGQRVICINDHFPWLKQHGGFGEAPDKPKLGEVLVIDEILGEFLRFDKYDTSDSTNWWIAKHFEPVDDNFEQEVAETFSGKYNTELSPEQERKALEGIERIVRSI